MPWPRSPCAAQPHSRHRARPTVYHRRHCSAPGHLLRHHAGDLAEPAIRLRPPPRLPLAGSKSPKQFGSVKLRERWRKSHWAPFSSRWAESRSRCARLPAWQFILFAFKNFGDVTPSMQEDADNAHRIWLNHIEDEDVFESHSTARNRNPARIGPPKPRPLPTCDIESSHVVSPHGKNP